MIWYILMVLLMVFLGWILFAPLIIYINTEGDRYLINLPGILKLAAIPSESLFYVRGWIFFIPFKIDPFKKRKERKKKEDKKGTEKKKTRKRSGNIRMLIEAIKAFRIRKLILDIDTDDYATNALLVPMLSSFNHKGNIQMQVNFEGKLFLHLDLRTRIGTLLWILFRNKQ